MAYQKGDALDVPFIAGGTISQYEPVMIDTSDTTGNTVIRVAATTDIPIGFSQIDATSGQEVSVRIAGVTKCRVGTAATIGLLGGIDGTDKAEVTNITESGSGTTLTWVHGQFMATGVTNDIVPLRLIMGRTLT